MPHERPPKRRFTEIGDSDDEDPDSDELYCWVEDDEVAAEGLVTDNGPSANNLITADPDGPTEVVPEKLSQKVAQ